MRKLILAYTTSLLMSPITGWALGMGDVQVNSHLNQPLKAEIELHSVTSKDLELLRVILAPKKVYLQADIERSHDLTKLIFNIVERNGKNYVSITTKKPFKVPFINFLVEANWGSGRLLREYTILLDPPDFIAQHTRPVTVTKLTSNSSQVNKVQAITQTNINRENSVLSKKQTDLILIPKNTTTLSSGIIKENDTLWHVAKKMAPADISVEQMMMALLRDNPGAFAHNNINNLKTGYVLRIKDRNSLNKISRTMANKQVNGQYQSWKESRKQKTTEHIVDRTVQQKKETKNEAKLSLIASGKTTKSGTNNNTGSSTEVLKEKLSLANEDLNSKQIEYTELKNRISELEALIKSKISLLELKDKSLAILQKEHELKRMNKDEHEISKGMQVSQSDILNAADSKVHVPTTANKDISSVAIKSSNLSE